MKVSFESNNSVDFLIVDENQWNDRVVLIMDSHYRKNQTMGGDFYWNLLNGSTWYFVLLNQDSNNVSSGIIRIYTNPAIIIVKTVFITIMVNETITEDTTELDTESIKKSNNDTNGFLFLSVILILLVLRKRK